MSEFFWVGNRLAVDFVNTHLVAEGAPLDLLQEPRDLVRWLQQAGTPAQVAAPQRLLRTARHYRTALREGMGRLAARSPVAPELLESTNLYLARQAERRVLAGEGGGYRYQAERRFRTPADFMAPVAESFADMLVHDDLTRLRKCRNPECMLYFYDTSKGGRRWWCSLQQCGNKMRMAAMRERRTSG